MSGIGRHRLRRGARRQQPLVFCFSVRFFSGMSLSVRRPNLRPPPLRTCFDFCSLSLSLVRHTIFSFLFPFYFILFFFLKAETLGVKTPRLDRAPVPGATQHFFFRFCLYSISFRFGFFSSSSPSSTWRITPTDHEAKFMEHNTKQKQTKTNQTPSPVARHRMKCFITFFFKFLVCVFF